MELRVAVMFMVKKMALIRPEANVDGHHDVMALIGAVTAAMMMMMMAGVAGNAG